MRNKYGLSLGWRLSSIYTLSRLSQTGGTEEWRGNAWITNVWPCVAKRSRSGVWPCKNRVYCKKNPRKGAKCGLVELPNKHTSQRIFVELTLEMVKYFEHLWVGADILENAYLYITHSVHFRDFKKRYGFIKMTLTRGKRHLIRSLRKEMWKRKRIQRFTSSGSAPFSYLDHKTTCILGHEWWFSNIAHLFTRFYVFLVRSTFRRVQTCYKSCKVHLNITISNERWKGLFFLPIIT